MILSLPKMATRVGRTFYYMLSNMRACDRLAVRGAVRIAYDDDQGNTVSIACDCVDFSPLGMGIFAGAPIPAGIDVSLYPGAGLPPRIARVRYCNPCDCRFRVGLAFTALDGLRRAS